MYTKTLTVFIVFFLFFLIFLFFSYQHAISDKKNDFKIAEKNNSLNSINSKSKKSLPILSDFKNSNLDLTDENIANMNSENYFIQPDTKYYISNSSNNSLRIIVISTAIVTPLKNDSKSGAFDTTSFNAPLYISTSVINPLSADINYAQNKLIITTKVIASMNNDFCNSQNLNSSNCTTF